MSYITLVPDRSKTHEFSCCLKGKHDFVAIQLLRALRRAGTPASGRLCEFAGAGT